MKLSKAARRVLQDLQNDDDKFDYFRCKRCRGMFKAKFPDGAFAVAVTQEEFLAMSLAGRTRDDYVVCDTCWQQTQPAGVGIGRGRKR
jgi:hypothetical protein